MLAAFHFYPTIDFMTILLLEISISVIPLSQLQARSGVCLRTLLDAGSMDLVHNIKMEADVKAANERCLYKLNCQKRESEIQTDKIFNMK